MKKTLYVLLLTLFSNVLYAQQGWKQYTTTNSSIPSNKINKVLKRANGEIWLATDNGLSKYDNGNFTNYTTADGLLSQWVKVINEDAQGNIWIGYGNYAGGVTKFDGTNFQSYYTGNGLVNDRVHFIFKLNNSICFGGKNDGITLYDGTTFSGGLSMQYLNMVQLNANEIALMTSSKVYKSSGSNSTEIPFQNGITQIFKGEFTAPAENELFFSAAYFDATLQQNKINYFHFQNNNLLKMNFWGGNATLKTTDGYYWFNRTNSLGEIVKYKNNESEFKNCMNGYLAREIKGFAEKGNHLFVGSDNGLIMGYIGDKGKSVERLDINEVQAYFGATGTLGANLPGGPKGFITKERHRTIYMSNMWIGGKSQSGDIHLAGERYVYFEIGSPGVDKLRDFVAGPIENDNSSPRYRNGRAWKVTKSEITYHWYNYMNSNYQMPDAIKHWPAHGNVAAGEAACLAPFHDMDQDGNYEPEEGDYPHIRGDQAIYVIYNDDINHHTKGKKLKVEVHMMAYAFNNGQKAVDNTIFVNYRIINRSNKNYNEVHLGVFTDFDLGNSFDDYVGSDSTLNLYYVYNGDELDESNDGIKGFKSNPPAMGVTFLNKKLSKMMYLSNSLGTTGDPMFYADYYNNLQGNWKDGSSLIYGGNGHMNSVQPPYNSTNYMFSGDPVTNVGWTEKSVSNTPGDRRALGATGPLTLNAGETIEFDIAYVYARDTNKTASGNVSTLRNSVQSVRQYFNNLAYPQLTGVCNLTGVKENDEASKNDEIVSYPNPTQGEVIVENNRGTIKQVQIFSIDGRKIREVLVNTAKVRINLENESPGIYLMRITSGEKEHVKKVILK